MHSCTHGRTHRKKNIILKCIPRSAHTPKLHDLKLYKFLKSYLSQSNNIRNIQIGIKTNSLFILVLVKPKIHKNRLVKYPE